MAESEEELKSLLTKVKEESEKAGLKLNIQKVKIMVSSPSSLWQKHGEAMETVRDFIFWTPIYRFDCSHEIEKRLFLGKKAVTKLDSILKSETLL